MENVLPLFPTEQQPCALHGLYLRLNLHRQAAPSDLLIYANYIASVDGRIALRDAESGDFIVPSSIANKRDWRLYQELAAQADVMLTSARYFRQLAKGKAQDLLPVGKHNDYGDLVEWRQEQGLKPQPDVVILSNSLDIPMQSLAELDDRRVIICTSNRADDEKINRFNALGIRVLVCGQHKVEGKLLKQQLIQAGYRSAYMISGPEVHRSLINAHVLDRLFLSTRLNLLGSDAFHSILNGVIDKATDLELVSLYFDQHQTSQQLFAQYRLQTTARGKKT